MMRAKHFSEKGTRCSSSPENVVVKEEDLSNDPWDAGSSASIGLASGSNNSAFLPVPYRAVTVLTNLQRGNVQTEESVLVPQQISWHTRAAMGEINAQDLNQVAHNGPDQESINFEDSCGLTALCWAASYGQVPTVRLLLSRGAEIEHEGEDGQTALQLCCAAGHHEVAKVLLAAGADPNHADHMSCSPLMFAAAEDHAQCVSELLDHKASLTATNFTGNTAYDIACRRNSLKAQAVMERYLLRLLDNTS
ncbi:ankyrin repeat family A protein 2 [Hyalella azteca]|uniref:Ankyrin repeat family A protein 2 n=1 Tax=Hyalella azteca TaxID=294128 RepID=A0A8B7NLE5_HYAAZ|nr:ankyrin repeat family A protein 2 [Hyalella azteca]